METEVYDPLHSYAAVDHTSRIYWSRKIKNNKYNVYKLFVFRLKFIMEFLRRRSMVRPRTFEFEA